MSSCTSGIHGFVKELDCAIEVFLCKRRLSQLMERSPDALQISELPGQCEALLAAPPGTLEVTLISCEVRRDRERPRSQSRGLLSPHRENVVGVRPSFREPAAHDPVVGERAHEPQCAIGLFDVRRTKKGQASRCRVRRQVAAAAPSTRLLTSRAPHARPATGIGRRDAGGSPGSRQRCQAARPRTPGSSRASSSASRPLWS